jgi:hypothetical protein
MADRVRVRNNAKHSSSFSASPTNPPALFSQMTINKIPQILHLQLANTKKQKSSSVTKKQNTDTTTVAAARSGLWVRVAAACGSLWSLSLTWKYFG